MSISFNGVPSDLRVPFLYAEFDSSKAFQGPAILRYKALIMAPKLSTGTATANVPVLVTSAAQAKTLFGTGSVGALMAASWFANNKTTELWMLPVADDGAGVQASSLVVFTGPATADGTLSFYVGGKLVETAVASGDTAIEVAAAFEAAINADTTLPVTANQEDSPNDHKVTLTFRHKGLVGNELDLRANYQSDEELPAGIGITIPAMAGGTTAPDIDNAIAALGDDWYQIICHPWTDATTLTDLETELSDRFGPLRQIDGMALTCSGKTLADLGTLGNSRNSPHSTILAAAKSPTAVYEIAAAYAAVVAYFAQIDPARPLQTLPLTGVKPPAVSDQFTLSERNTLLYDGIATMKPSAGGIMRIERAVTTYKTSPAGADDIAYLDVETLMTLMYIRYDFRTYWLNKYPRHKLADDGTRFGDGQKIMTPKIARAECIMKFRQWERLGLVEGIDQFKNDLIVERNESNPNRLDMMLPPDLINQLRVVGVQIGFLLQSVAQAE